MADQYSWNTFYLQVLITVILCLTFQVHDVNGCPTGCQCVLSGRSGKLRVECVLVTSMPDSADYPFNADEFLIVLRGYPGIPSGSFAGRTGIYKITISGEIGDIKSGAFNNIQGSSTIEAEINIQNHPASGTSLADIHTIEQEAFYKITGFRKMVFIYAAINVMSTGAFTDIAGMWEVSFSYTIIKKMEGGALNQFVGGQTGSVIKFQYSTIELVQGCAFVGVDGWMDFHMFYSSVDDLKNYAFAGISNIVSFKLEGFTVTASYVSSYKGIGKVNNFILTSVSPTPIISADPALQDATVAKEKARQSCNLGTSSKSAQKTVH